MNSRKLLEEGRRDELWTKHCGFFTLTPDEFMDVQKRLLLEQIALLGKSLIGKKMFGNTLPTSVEEFRQNVPLTTYSNYQEYFDKQNEDVLPASKTFCVGKDLGAHVRERTEMDTVYKSYVRSPGRFNSRRNAYGFGILFWRSKTGAQ